MIINNRFFVAPPNDGSDIKELLQMILASGAGRPVDSQGVPEGPWTAELLADAISLIDVNQRGIDARTVQLWFQDNKKGVGTENIRWLARVLGCGDTNYTVAWQSELVAAQGRLVASRRKKSNGLEVKTPETDQTLIAENNADSKNAGGTRVRQPALQSAKVPQTHELHTNMTFAEGSHATTLHPTDGAEEFTRDRSDLEPDRGIRQKPLLSHWNIAGRSEALFVGQNAFNLVIFSWSIYVMIGLANYIFGLQSITYSPVEGLDKEVGFLAAPTWTILPLVILPLFIIFFGEMLTFWRVEIRPNFCIEKDHGWDDFVALFSLPVWAITIVCVGFVFGFQWFGIYVRIYWLGDVGHYQVDRTLVTLLRPDAVSTTESVIASLFGYLYTGWFIWIFLVVMLFQYVISADFVGNTRRRETQEIDPQHLRYVGNKLMLGVFQCSVLGIWIAMSIKLQGAYLSSDSPNILDWLVRDGLSVLSSTNEGNGVLENQSPSYFTTSLMLGIVLFIVASSMLQIARALRHPQQSDPKHALITGGVDRAVSMIFVLAWLSTTLLCIGQIQGFSLFLLGGVIASVYFVTKLTNELR